MRFVPSLIRLERLSSNAAGAVIAGECPNREHSHGTSYPTALMVKSRILLEISGFM